jgi:hypothetical protein
MAHLINLPKKSKDLIKEEWSFQPCGSGKDPMSSDLTGI